MSRNRRKSRDDFESSFSRVVSPIVVLVLAIGAGMGFAGMVLNSFGERDVELVEETVATPIKSSNKSFSSERANRRSFNSEPALKKIVRAEAPAVMTKPTPALKKAFVEKAQSPKASRVASPIIPAAKPMKIAQVKPIVPQAPESGSFSRSSTIVVEKVVYPKVAKAEPQPVRAPEPMEDLSQIPEPALAAPVMAQEEEDNVFDEVVPAPPESAKSKPVRIEREARSPEKKIAKTESAKGSSGPQSFKDRLKKSSDDKDEETVTTQAATRSFQDRLRKSAK